MLNQLKNFFNIAKKTAEETIESASVDLKEMADAVSEDTEKLVENAKEAFRENVGEPSEIVEKAKVTLKETSEKFKEAVQEEMENASEKFNELKDTVKQKGEDAKEEEV